MQYFTTIALLVTLTLTFMDCRRKTIIEAPKMHENCAMKPDAGPCRMAVKRYYYDEQEKKCKEFTYGGCKGAVPFETLEECQKGCNCK
jgi:hypothetical protein